MTGFDENGGVQPGGSYISRDSSVDKMVGEMIRLQLSVVYTSVFGMLVKRSKCHP